MFYNLPLELQDRIYDLSGNFKAEYEKSLNILRKFPKFTDSEIQNNNDVLYNYVYYWDIPELGNREYLFLVRIPNDRKQGIIPAYGIALCHFFNPNGLKQIKLNCPKVPFAFLYS